MAKKPARPRDGRKDFVAMLKSLCHRHSLHRVFRDAMELFALSFANAADKRPSVWEPREARYLEILKVYSPEEVQTFPKLLGALTDAYGPTMEDLFGSLFHELELQNEWKGQFFTPFHLSSMMSRMLLDKEHVRRHIARRGFFTMMDPACGAGGMILAAADAVMSDGYNPQQCMHATGIDVDLLCVHMTFVQCTLWHLPAVIHHGNSLSMEIWSTWRTPAHMLGFWDAKLYRADNPTWLDLSTPQRLRLCLKHDLDPDLALDSAPPPALQGITIPPL